jgi:hypothetical protein
MGSSGSGGSSGRSAQTPSESSQSSSSSGTVDELDVRINQLVAGTQYQIYHVWKGKPHHSHIRLREFNGAPRINFGLFNSDGDATIVCKVVEGNGYNVSASYRANPVLATGAQIAAAYTSAINACGGKYSLFGNNCQKFARLFMTNLGSVHRRQLFHP